MGLFGPPNVEKMKAKGDVKGLIKALGYQKDMQVSTAAADALIEMSAPGFEPLIAALADREWRVRTAAADLLVKIGAPAVEPLVAALKDRNRPGREAVASVLGQIGDVRAVGPLIAALGRSPVRTAAVDALVKIGAPAVKALTGALTSSHGGAAEVLVRIGTPAVEPLIAALTGSPMLASEATAVLAKIGAPAVGSLIAALRGSDGSLRRAAAGVLDKMGWRPAQDEISAAYWVVKRQWGKCVEIGAPAAGPLAGALMDSDSGARRAAADALDKIGWQPSQDEKGAAYWVLKREWDKCLDLGAPAVAPLIAALGDSARPVRKAAAEVLVKLYRSGQLDKARWFLVWEQRHKISSHKDGPSHSDGYFSTRSSDCSTHTDESNHADEGIGVPFPE